MKTLPAAPGDLHPYAYRDLLQSALLPGAPVILVEDESDWPVVRIRDRHVFQPSEENGARTPVG